MAFDASGVTDHGSNADLDINHEANCISFASDSRGSRYNSVFAVDRNTGNRGLR